MDMKKWLYGLVLGLMLSWAMSTGIAAAQEQPAAQGGWEQQAEESFYLPQGTGGRLMNQEEWQQHRQKMQSMNAQERDRYRQEWHKRMMQRAHECGVGMPEMPGGHGMMGPGGGMGGGMGHGGGY
jgi:hypothetical protein